MAAVSFEQWRWQWMETQSGGLLSRFAPLLQKEHQVRWLPAALCLALYFVVLPFSHISARAPHLKVLTAGFFSGAVAEQLG